ncbi:MAG: efflux RND transporter periplasmic adaptor subunit [Bradyrhizobium sp.]|uniref:efflux RND transporter periplasmic adaptor subunit n=1 Tax=Bradyrhizobium sp. TaxID=376 RepID=UPI001DDB8A20|nr:efflux RND transporter periplasmic adaptor subunit [Bradyrhizobium sp.]MBV9559709.1 efflux RND transporter periplasmic adaptor subunit [Bradyrhizobium sp.]
MGHTHHRAAARLTLASLALLSPLLAACGSNPAPAQNAAPPPPAVTVAKPEKRTIVDQDEYVGRFAAVDSVEVRSRLSGYLASIHFTDGQMVKKGDLLFTIDRRPFQMILDQARANLAQSRATLSYAEADLARGEQLVRDKTITTQVFDQRTQAKRVAEAAVHANEALVHQAELDFQEYSQLRAPIDGRIGDRRVSPGNLIPGGTSGSTTLLATIVSIDPIRFEFTFDESAYLRYERMNRGKDWSSIPVKLKLLDENGFEHDGRMDFVDNAISQTSGTIRGRAVFANPSGLFTPGMFGRIQVPGSPPYQALLVPDVAIGTEQTRKFVMVVDGDNTARQNYVTIGPTIGGLRVVKDGLKDDDNVIVDGLMRVRPGVKVKPQEKAAPATAGGPSSKTD